MPISYTIDSSSGVVYTRALGMVTTEEFIAHINTLGHDKELPFPLVELWDGRQIEHLKMQVSELRSIIELLMTFEKKFGKATIALVTGNKVHYYFGKISQVFMQLTEYSFEVFQDCNTAEGWLLSQKS